MKYCGREFTDAELKRIQILADLPSMNRHRLSLQTCKELEWRKQDGGLKDMSCRVALLRMQEDGLIKLPAVRPRRGGYGVHSIGRTAATEQQPSILTPAGELKRVLFELVTKSNSHLWNEFIDRYHYLGYKPLPGAQLRYFVRSDTGLLALFGFGAAAWKVAPRDQFIGWSPSIREKRLHLIINNARFLILPWIHSKNLASKLLGEIARRIGDDWYNRYGYRPVLLETFVEKERFTGTCYRAANWTYLGDTQGRGKLDRSKAYALPIKSIWTFPLSPKFRQILTDPT
jgi:hypothetical protein